MGTPYLGEIRLCSFNFAPKNWALCNGQLLPINTNQALFSLLGTTYGGNGQTTFALPDLRGRRPLHDGNGYTWGQSGGAEAHTLTLAEMPAHTHYVRVQSAVGTQEAAAGGYVAASGVDLPFAGSAQGTSQQLLTSVGGSQAHMNLPPYLVLNFIIALQGVFPSQN